MNTEKGYASLMEAYNKDLKEKSRSKEELDLKLKWVLSRATAYAEVCGVERDDVLKDAIDKAIEWWKGKVIFTRPLSADDAKAWKMINKQVETLLKSIEL